jgi:hypothetical protein
VIFSSSYSSSLGTNTYTALYYGVNRWNASERQENGSATRSICVQSIMTVDTSDTLTVQMKGDILTLLTPVITINTCTLSVIKLA